MEELGMRALLESNHQWEFAFGDVGELVNQEDDEVETNEITTAQEQHTEVPATRPATTEYSTENEKEEFDDLLQVLETFEKKEIINSEAKVKLATISKNQNVSTGGKTTIPIHKIAETENRERQKFKKDRKFIEIIHNDESVFVRKTTLVWLFRKENGFQMIDYFE